MSAVCLISIFFGAPMPLIIDNHSDKFRNKHTKESVPKDSIMIENSVLNGEDFIPSFIQLECSIMIDMCDPFNEGTANIVE